jgi:aspartyl-tRNA(Asn)/glutamyl-tRNA(Gln) amidotransferase subunit B
LTYEIVRQREAVEAGDKLVQETRLWDPQAGITISMRTKEDSADYRYFPEPDIPPYTPTNELIAELTASLPKLPDVIETELKDKYGLSTLDAAVVTSDKALYDFFEETKSLGLQQLQLDEATLVKKIINWLSGSLLGYLNDNDLPLSATKLKPDHIISIIDLIEKNEISASIGKELISEAIISGASPSSLVQEKGLEQISDTDVLSQTVDDVLVEHSAVVTTIKAGKAGAIGFLVGHVMKKTGGKANPQMVQELIKQKINL